MTSSLLRVGIAIPSPVQPAWVCRAIARVEERHQLAFIRVAPGAEVQRTPAAARAFERMDSRLFRSARSGLEPCPLQTLERGEADLVLAFGGAAAPSAAEVWHVESDGLTEFLRSPEILSARLRSADGVIDSTTAMPDGISYGRAMSNLGWRVASMIEHALDRRARGVTVPPSREAPEETGNPSTAAVFAAVLRAGRGWARYKFRKRFTRKQWGLAFAFGAAPDGGTRGFHRVLPPPDRLWADPFVVTREGRTWIFLEELVYEENRGVIAVMEVHRDGTWSSPERILERPYHLSYPCVFPWNGEWYMVPESEANGTVDLHRCTGFPLRWQHEKTLFRGVHAVDTTLFEWQGRWWMYYATDSGDGEGFDRLWLFHAETPLGPWQPHAWNPLQCTVRGGRPGGRPFLLGHRLVRATQVGTPYYGYAIDLREIVTLTPDRWEERLVRTIRPDRREGDEATHTINVAGDCVVMDAMRIRRRM